MPNDKPKMVRVEVLKPHSYGGLLYEVGDHYEAADKEAETLTARGWVKVGGSDKRRAKPPLSAGIPVPVRPEGLDDPLR